MEESSSDKLSRSDIYSCSLEKFLSEVLSTSSPLLPNSGSAFEFTDSYFEESRLLPTSLSVLEDFLALIIGQDVKRGTLGVSM